MGNKSPSNCSSANRGHQCKKKKKKKKKKKEKKSLFHKYLSFEVNCRLLVRSNKAENKLTLFAFFKCTFVCQQTH